MRTWRERLRAIIATVIQLHAGESEREVRKVLREAYPFGECRYHPYKIWCDEIRVQLGKKKPAARSRTVVSAPQCPGQRRLFEEATDGN